MTWKFDYLIVGAGFAGLTAAERLCTQFGKIDRIHVPLLDGLPRREADNVLAEGREHACLRWLVCTPGTKQR